jgi:hypothetical protein
MLLVLLCTGVSLVPLALKIATLVLPKMIAFTHIRTNVIALNTSSSTRFEIVPLVLPF